MSIDVPSHPPSIMRSEAQHPHESWRLPESLALLAPPNLTVAVAWWGVLRGDFFSRNDVASVFAITPRRASGVLEYLTRRANLNIEFEKKVQHRGPVRQMRLKIVSVDGKRMQEACEYCQLPAPPSLPSEGTTLQRFMQIKKFMLQHRWGTPLPSALLTHAASASVIDDRERVEVVEMKGAPSTFEGTP